MINSTEICELNENEIEDIENRLDKYDEDYIKYKLHGKINLGIKENGKLIAGVDACMTAFKILYVSTFFVDEEYRRQGIGKKLLEEVEVKARALGANMIRLDTFNWQGKEFYKHMGYEEVGSYTSEDDEFSEHFFLKRL